MNRVLKYMRNRIGLALLCLFLAFSVFLSGSFTSSRRIMETVQSVLSCADEVFDFRLGEGADSILEAFRSGDGILTAFRETGENLLTAVRDSGAEISGAVIDFASQAVNGSDETVPSRAASETRGAGFRLSPEGDERLSLPPSLILISALAAVLPAGVCRLLSRPVRLKRTLLRIHAGRYPPEEKTAVIC